LSRESALPRWGVHATVDEPVELLCAYVAYHLALGASEVHLYLDRPDAQVAAILGGVSGVHVIQCDEAYWAASDAGSRPVEKIRRQIHNATRTHANSALDWLLHLDADEFLWTPEPFAAVLARVPAAVRYLRLRCVERVLEAGVEQRTIFDGVYRGTLARWPQRGEAVYGKAARYMIRGMVGHLAGKSVTRTRLPVQIRAHVPTGLDGETLQPEYDSFAEGPQIVHFDGLTPLHFVIKHLRYHAAAVAGMAPGKDLREAIGGKTEARARQIMAVHKVRQDPETMRRLLRALLHLEPAQIATLRDYGALAGYRIDPAAAALRLFPGAGLDFGAARFDAALRSRHAAVIEEAALAI
jgi:hypothetical protein